ncbi:MAG: 50S ribosomal protein L31 [Chloroflexota bacterium]|nr:50S ribosomal protein L31 [Chloroflexota bacterium]
MKENLHPKWFAETTVICACGNTWKTGATVELIKTDICSACHPFYTGEQRIVDTEGQVDRFMKRLQVRDVKRAEVQTRDAARDPINTPIAELGIDRKVIPAFTDMGLNTAGEIHRFITERGEEALLEIPGIGRKIVADLKKALRVRGFEIDKAAAE